MTELEEHLKDFDIFPVMGKAQGNYNFAPIDLGISNKQIEQYSSDELATFIHSNAQSNNAAFSIGGYLEQRNLYASSEHFRSGTENRNIHLAIDIWGPVNTPIYAPIHGRIHSFAYNNAALDYGYTLILYHNINGFIFHTLYGHLSSAHFNSWNVGKTIEKGSQIAHIGNENENGGWIPHLHFQVIIDMEGKSGDYPGVCAKSNLLRYKQNCPDPSPLIKKAPKEF